MSEVEKLARKLAELDGVSWDLPEIKGKGKYLNVPKGEYLKKAKSLMGAGYRLVEPVQLEVLTDERKLE